MDMTTEKNAIGLGTSPKASQVENINEASSRNTEERLEPVGTSTTANADHALEQLGYEPELTRTKSTLHVVLMTFVLSATPYGLSSSLYYSLVNGGPVTVIWGFVLVCSVILCLAASLAEITSVYPTAGGVYYQTFVLCPAAFRRLAAWVCGWSIVAGTVIITLSVGFGTAQFAIACLNVFESSPGAGDFWEPSTYQVFLIFLAITLLCNSVAIFGNRWLHILDAFAVFSTLIGLICICVCSLAIADDGRRSAEFVFTHFEPLSGWIPGWAFCVGLLQAAYTTSATGMITSMCEEASNPAVQVPKAIVGVVGVNTIVGLLFMIAMMFVLPDLEMLVNLSSGQPLPAILRSAVGNAAGAFCLTIPIQILCFCAMVGCTTSASRYIFAFARDGGIPGSQWWRTVNQRLAMPLNATLLSMGVQIALGFTYFGSTAAFNAFTGAGVIFLTMGYISPVLVSFISGRKDLKSGSFYLGEILGKTCNVVAIAWSIFAIPVFCMPAAIPVTLLSMNYASPVFCGFVVLAAGWYWAWGLRNYQGPPVQQDLRNVQLREA